VLASIDVGQAAAEGVLSAILKIHALITCSRNAGPVSDVTVERVPVAVVGGEAAIIDGAVGIDTLDWIVGTNLRWSSCSSAT